MTKHQPGDKQCHETGHASSAFSPFCHFRFVHPANLPASSGALPSLAFVASTCSSLFTSLFRLPDFALCLLKTLGAMNDFVSLPEAPSTRNFTLHTFVAYTPESSAFWAVTRCSAHYRRLTPVLIYVSPSLLRRPTTFEKSIFC